MKKILFLLGIMHLLSTANLRASYDPEKQPGTMQYFTPVGGAYFVGDCIPFAHDGTYYLYWLLDEGHHSALGGLGGHHVKARPSAPAALRWKAAQPQPSAASPVRRRIHIIYII